MPDPTTPQEKSHTVTLRKGERIILKKSGGNLRVYAGYGGIEQTDITLSKKDTLVIKGSGSGHMEVDKRASFAPRVSVQTDQPLLVKGSFVAMGDSTQVALVDVTPVELTAMRGADKPSGKKRIEDYSRPGKTMSVPEYKLSTSGSNLKQASRSSSALPSEAKYLRYTRDRRTYTVAVEPTGGRVDFVNGKDGNEPLFTLDGKESMDVTEMRFKRARNAAMSEVAKVVDIDNNLSGSGFTRAKERSGIAKTVKKGMVSIKSVGRVDINVTPVAAMSDFIKVAEPAPTFAPGDSPEQKMQKVMVAKIEGYVGKPDGKGGYTATRGREEDHRLLTKGRMSRALGVGEDNLAVQLGNTMREVRETATNLTNERTGAVRKDELAALHRGLKKIDRLSDDILGELKYFDPATEHDDRAKVERIKVIQKRIIERTNAIKKDFNGVSDRLNKMESLKDPSKRRNAIFGSESSALDGQEEEGVLQRLALEAMGDDKPAPSLAVADVDSGPEASPLSLPSGKTGGPDKSGNRAA